MLLLTNAGTAHTHGGAVLKLNTIGEDALETLQLANPGHTIGGAGWLTDDLILTRHPNGSLWRCHREHAFDLLRAPRLYAPSVIALLAGGRSWVGEQADNRLTGELIDPAGPTPYPVELAERIPCDIARETGAVLVVDPDSRPPVLTVLRGRTTPQPLQAPRLALPPRLSACGRAVTWVDQDRPTSVQVQAGSARLAMPLPGIALLATPKLIDIDDHWWVLSVTREAGLALTPLDDIGRGYQWPVPDPAAIHDLDVYTNGQTFVVWETGTGKDRQVHRSDGFAAGLEPIVIAVRPLAPPDFAQPPAAPAAVSEPVAETPDEPSPWVVDVEPDPTVAPVPVPAGEQAVEQASPGDEPADPVTAILDRIDQLERTLAGRQAPVSSDPATLLADVASRLTRVEKTVKNTMSEVIVAAFQNNTLTVRVWGFTLCTLRMSNRNTREGDAS